MSRSIILQAADRLEKILEGKVDPCHGIEHAITVMAHASTALAWHSDLTDDQILAVQLAALLHDADDRKFFSTSQELTNAREVLADLQLSTELVDLILKMISLVSCSKNGNSQDGAEEEWMLYPRFADRLEALGEIGIVRCWVYTYHVKRPLFTEETPRPTTQEELRVAASSDRFAHYVSQKGKVGSSSFIDHFYDKLLHIGDVGSNPYFVEEAAARLKIMEAFLLEFGRTGQIDEVYLQKLADKHGIVN